MEPVSPPTRTIRLGLLGCGVVGTGILRLLEENQRSIQQRLGAPLEVRKIAVRDPARPRDAIVPPALLVADPQEVVADPEIDIVVEVMGGVDPAESLVRAALESGKHVVTANKALLAEQCDALLELAEARGVDLYFEAAVAGGVPIIRVLREALASDRVAGLRGIVNGTSNYILSRMSSSGMDFGAALREAQEKGYAEADPTLDVSGGDARHKLAILATMAFGARVSSNAIPLEGIEKVSALDIASAARFGYVIKPLVVARPTEGGALDLRVHPALVADEHVLASIHGALNAVFVEGAMAGPVLLSGPGAGAAPTAMSVVSDVVDVGRNMLSGAHGRVPTRAFRGESLRSLQVQALADHRSRYYLRFDVRDQPGVLGRLASVLGAHDVSIEQMVQDGDHSADEPVAVVMVTHCCREGDLRDALGAMGDQDLRAEPTVLRIED